MKNQIIKSLLVMAAIMTQCMTLFSCKDHEDVVEDNLPPCYVDKSDLLFESNKGDVRELKITCTGKWKISGVPEWLTAESTEGNGSTTVKFTTCRANQSSSSTNGMLLVTFAENADAQETVDVVQQGGAVADCVARPNLVVTLSNGIAFDFTFDKGVARYYRGYIEASSAGRMSDEEIIQVLESDFSRHVPSEDEVADFDGLKSGTRYILYTLAFDSEGNRGELYSTEVSTLGKRSNEPEAWISNMRSSGGYWYWTVTKSATCNSYYMLSTEDYDVAVASDVLQAWWLEYAAKEGVISEYVNGTDWKQKMGGSILAVWTRGVDTRGNKSGVIGWEAISVNSTRSGSNEKGGSAGDHSGHKLSPGQYSLYMVN